MRWYLMDVTPIIRKDFLTFSRDAKLSEMIGQLRQSNKRFGLVLESSQYLGIVERKNLLKNRLNTTETTVGKYLTKAPMVNEHADIFETAYLMFKSNLDFIPVESNSKIIGVIEAKDLASLALLLPEAQKFTVKDLTLVKTRPLNKTDTVAKALQVMYTESIDQVPVSDEKGVYGVISYRDLLKKYLIWSPKREHSSKMLKERGGTRSAESDHAHLSSLPVSAFSTNENLVTTEPNELLKELMKKLQNSNVTCAIVLKNGHLRGLVTVKNIVRAIASLNIPKNFNIRFVGLSKLQLEEYDIRSIKKIASNEAFKLQRDIQNDEFSLVVHVKEYNKAGNRRKFSVHLRVESPGETIAVDQFDWDIRRAFHKAFDNAKNKVCSDLRSPAKLRVY